MDQFLEGYNLPNLTQTDVGNMSRTMYVKETESIIIFQNKAPGPVGFTGEFYWIFKEEIIPILYNLFQRIEAEGILPNSFYKASITFIPKTKTSEERKTTDQYLSWTQMQKSLTKYKQADSINV